MHSIIIIKYLLFFILSSPAVQYAFGEFVGEFLLLFSSRGVFAFNRQAAVSRPVGLERRRAECCMSADDHLRLVESVFAWY